MSKQQHLPSVEALTSSDDAAWIAELRMSEVREQLEAARSILDAIADGQPSPSDFAARIARLGCRFVEIAGALSRSDAVRRR
jgi:hypothetical protein